MKQDRNGMLLTQITQAIYKKADAEHLDKDRVAEFISDLQHVFRKDPKKRDMRCWASGSGLSLELHHIAGRNNSELTCTLSKRAHVSLSNKQQTWDSRWVCADNSDELRNSFVVNGVYELLVEKHFRTGIKDYRIMADALPNLIKSYREKVDSMTKKDTKQKTRASLGSAAKQKDSFSDLLYKNCIYESEYAMIDHEGSTYRLYAGGYAVIPFSGKELMAIKDALVAHFGK
jgi:hypothetical protein